MQIRTINMKWLIVVGEITKLFVAIFFIALIFLDWINMLIFIPHFGPSQFKINEKWVVSLSKYSEQKLHNETYFFLVISVLISIINNCNFQKACSLALKCFLTYQLLPVFFLSTVNQTPLCYFYMKNDQQTKCKYIYDMLLFISKTFLYTQQTFNPLVLMFMFDGKTVLVLQNVNSLLVLKETYRVRRNWWECLLKRT